MRVTFCKYHKKLFTGNFLTCLVWASDIAMKKNLTIPIFTVRPESSDARLIAEVSSDGVRFIPRGRYAKILKGAVWVNL